MVSLSLLVLVYVVGGLTFIPLALVCLLAGIFLLSPRVASHSTSSGDGRDDSLKRGLVTRDPDAARLRPMSYNAAVNTGQGPTGARGMKRSERQLYRAGWLTVRRTFERIPLQQADGSSTGMVGMVMSGYRSLVDGRGTPAAAANKDGGAGGAQAANGSGNAGATANEDAAQSKTAQSAAAPSAATTTASAARAGGGGGGGVYGKELFFCVLKQNVLFLYENEDQTDCWAAVELTLHQVEIYAGATDEDNVANMTDGELFIKRSAIRLTAKAGDGLDRDVSGDLHPDGQFLPGRPAPWYLFARVNSDKEDWYHSLVQASKLGGDDEAEDDDDKMFNPDDMARLIDGLDEQPDSIPVRWLNALLGRVFFAVYKTDALEHWIVSKIVKKLRRVKTPSILSEIQVREATVGDSAPLFSRPMLKELTQDGDASMEVTASYRGNARVTIETVATIQLGARFKPYSVRLVLAVVLKELEGTLLFKVKRPPSNRVWFGFSSMPRMVLSIEPVVSTRQIKWSMITSPIESRIREIILESIVVPHMDDLPFFDSRAYSHRGGIWGDALRRERDLSKPTGVPSATAPPPTAPADNKAEVSASKETAPVSAAEDSAARSRPPGARRRTSSDAQIGTQPTASSSTWGFSTPRVASASSSAFSLAGWRKDGGQATNGVARKSSVGSEHASRKLWFGGAKDSASKSTTSLDAAPSSAPPVANDEAVNTPPTPHDSLDRSSSAPSPVPSAPAAVEGQASATRLRELLEQRARSRERERASSNATASDAPTVLGTSVPLSHSPSNLSLAGTTSEDGTAVASEVTAEPLKLAPEVPIEEAPPPLGARLSFNRDGVPSSPPLSRRGSHTTTQSFDSSGSSASVFGTWRNKAADKQAIAAGVNQARDAVKRWGVAWNAKRNTWQTSRHGDLPPMSDEDSIIDEYGNRFVTSHASESPERVGRTMSRDTFSSAEQASAPIPIAGRRPPPPRERTSLSSSPGHFEPAAPQPTTQLYTTAAVAPGSPSLKPVVSSPPKPDGGSMRSYKANSMSIPGIRSEVQRKAVASDHYSADQYATTVRSPSGSLEAASMTPPAHQDSMTAPPLLALDQTAPATPPTDIEEVPSTSTTEAQDSPAVVEKEVSDEPAPAPLAAPAAERKSHVEPEPVLSTEDEVTEVQGKPALSVMTDEPAADSPAPSVKRRPPPPPPRRPSEPSAEAPPSPTSAPTSAKSIKRKPPPSVAPPPLPARPPAMLYTSATDNVVTPTEKDTQLVDDGALAAKGQDTSPRTDDEMADEAGWGLELGDEEPPPAAGPADTPLRA